MNDADCNIHNIQWDTTERGEDCPACKADELLNHIKDILIGRGFADPLVQEIQAYFLNQGKPE